MSVIPVSASQPLARSRSRLDHALATSAAVIGTHIHCTVERFRNHSDEGMTTAEYAVGLLAAVAFAAVLLSVLTSGQVKGDVTKLVTDALKKP